MFKIILKLSYKRISSYVLMFIFLILFSIIILLSNASCIIMDYIDSFTTKSFDSRVLMVDAYDNSKINEIKLMDNVTEVIGFNDLMGWISFNEDNYAGLYAIGDEELKNIEVTSGSKDLSENNLICPEVFIALSTDKYSKEEIIKNTYYPKDSLNKTLEVKFSKIKYFDEPGKSEVIESKIEKYKIVGTYNNKKYAMKSNTCFIAEDGVKKIRDYETYDLEEKEQQEAPFYAVIVSNVKYKEQIRSRIDKLGYKVENQVAFETKPIFVLSTIAVVVLCVVLFAISKVVSLNIKMNLANKEKEILLYKSIGYDNKKILLLNIYEYLFTIVPSTILSIMFSYMIFGLERDYLKTDLMYDLLDIKLYPFAIIITLIIGVLYSLWIVYRNTKKVIKSSRIII